MDKVTAKETTKVVKSAEDERWRNSSVYPEIMVSSKGRVKEREYQRIVKDTEDGCFRIYNVPQKAIQPTVSGSGEVMVSFYSNRKWTSESVAFLVAKEFVANEDPEHLTRIRFRDKNKTNVNASNLYWDGTGIFSKV